MILLFWRTVFDPGPELISQLTNALKIAHTLIQHDRTVATHEYSASPSHTPKFFNAVGSYLRPDELSPLMAQSGRATHADDVCFEGNNGHDAGVTAFPLMTQSRHGSVNPTSLNYVCAPDVMVSAVGRFETSKRLGSTERARAQERLRS